MKWYSRTTFALCLSTPLLFAAPAFASVLFRGDFETGDLSQWQATEAGNPDRIGVVTSPVAQGKYAMRSEVHQGDLINGGYRNEVDWFGQPTEGTERWYHWYTYWPDDYKAADTWQVFTQFHQYKTGGSPPVEFDVWGNEIRLTTNGVDNTDEKIRWRAPLVRGKWHEFLLHVKWSSDPSQGFIELYYDGQLAMPLTRMRTMPPGDTVYLKQGLYRSRSIDFPQTIYHDGMVVGTTRADVEPAKSSAPGGVAPGNPGSGPTRLPGSGPVKPGFPMTPGVGASPMTGGCSAAGGGVPLALGLLPLGLGALWFRRRTSARCRSRR